MTLRIAAALWLIWALGSGALAHETTRSYLTVTRDGATATLALRLAFRDIEVIVWADEDLDGAITWGEARRRLDAVSAYVAASLLADAGGACTLTRTGAGASSGAGIDYLDLAFAAACPDARAPLRLTQSLFADIDPDHRMFVTARTGGTPVTTLLGADTPTVTLTDTGGSAAATFASYFREGIRHLLGGADHLVFLLVLMLPAVGAGAGPRKAVPGVLAAVTGFTLAHAVTLTAAATDWLRPPTGIIEVMIALSIVITAADNLRPFIPAPRAAVAAFFGIIHGFGFASALGVLDLSGAELVTALIGFNLGIEAAQVAVVLICLPALYMLRGGGWLVRLGSLGAGLAGLGWVWLRIAA